MSRSSLARGTHTSLILPTDSLERAGLCLSRLGGKAKFHIEHLWDYPNLSWGNYTRPIALVRGYKNGMCMRLTDTDES